MTTHELNAIRDRFTAYQAASGLAKEQLGLQLLDDVPGLVEALTWQPIETAPKDGTYVETIVAEPGCHPSITHFEEYFGIEQWGNDPETFNSADEFEEYWTSLDYRPTHWKPLPDAP